MLAKWSAALPPVYRQDKDFLEEKPLGAGFSAGVSVGKNGIKNGEAYLQHHPLFTDKGGDALPFTVVKSTSSSAAEEAENCQQKYTFGGFKEPAPQTPAYLAGAGCGGFLRCWKIINAAISKRYRILIEVLAGGGALP